MTPALTARQLDLRGKTITTFIAHALHQGLADMAKGDQISLVTDAYPAIDIDMRAWSRATGHAIRDTSLTGSEWTFTIEKGETSPSGRKLAMVVSDDGLLELLSPLAFALAAALEGHQVALYLQGPAVRVVTKGFTPRIHGFGKPFSRFARKGMAKAGHVPPQVKLAELLELGADVFVCAGSMDHFKVAQSDFAFEGLTVAEYLTFIEVMADAEMQIYI